MGIDKENIQRQRWLNVGQVKTCCQSAGADCRHQRGRVALLVDGAASRLSLRSGHVLSSPSLCGSPAPLRHFGQSVSRLENCLLFGPQSCNLNVLQFDKLLHQKIRLVAGRVLVSSASFANVFFPSNRLVKNPKFFTIPPVTPTQ